jgi:tetratricopeptide (TPR) repeat protein
MRIRVRHAILVLATLPLLGVGISLWGVWISRSKSGVPKEVVSLVRAHAYPEAQAELAVYLRDRPDDDSAHLLMAQIATERPDPQPDVALDHLRRVRPDSRAQAALAKFFEGKAHYVTKRYDLAESCWRESVRLDPLVPEAAWALVDLLDLEGRPEEAHRVGMRQYEVEPNPRDRARILLELSRIDIDKVAPGSLVQVFEPLHRQHPEERELAIVVGLALVHDSRGAQGLEVLQDLLRRDPDSPEAWDAWLTGLDDAGEHERLATELARVPQTLMADPRFAVHEGRVAQNAHDWKKAARAYERAYKVKPYDGVLLYRLHQVLRLGGERAEAERVERALTAYQSAFKQLRGVYEEALKLRTLGTAPHPEICHRLAALREQMGRWDEARAWHLLVLKNRPDDALSLAAIERMK